MGEEEGKTYRPLKLPQFWHCTVMCSVPASLDVKVWVPQVKKKNMVAGCGRVSRW